jgi:hypothetical protein
MHFLCLHFVTEKRCFQIVPSPGIKLVFVQRARLHEKGGLLDISIRLDTSTKCLKLFYTSPQPILGETYFITNVYTNIIYNFDNISYSIKQTVFQKQKLFFEKLHFLQNLDCTVAVNDR